MRYIQQSTLHYDSSGCTRQCSVRLLIDRFDLGRQARHLCYSLLSGSRLDLDRHKRLTLSSLRTFDSLQYLECVRLPNFGWKRELAQQSSQAYSTLRQGSNSFDQRELVSGTQSTRVA